jgi:hypothetical protein
VAPDPQARARAKALIGEGRWEERGMGVSKNHE